MRWKLVDLESRRGSAPTGRKKKKRIHGITPGSQEVPTCQQSRFSLVPDDWEANLNPEVPHRPHGGTHPRQKGLHFCSHALLDDDRLGVGDLKIGPLLPELSESPLTNAEQLALESAPSLKRMFKKENQPVEDVDERSDHHFHFHFHPEENHTHEQLQVSGCLGEVRIT